MKRQLPSQVLEEQFFGLSTRRAPLSDSIRLGAQLMLQKAVELEVTEFLGRDYYQRSGDGALQGYRNGYEDKHVQTAEGRLHLKMPQSATPSKPLTACGCERWFSVVISWLR
jgi:putative transposase